MPDLDDLVLPPMEFDDNDMTRMYGAQRTASMAMKGAVEAMHEVQKNLAKTVEGMATDNYQEHELLREEIREVNNKAKAANDTAVMARITMDRARWYLRGIYAAGAAIVAALVFLPSKVRAAIGYLFFGW